MATPVTADFTFNSGKHGVSFYSVPTEASVTLLIEAADHSQSSCYIEYMQLSCVSMNTVALYDGSDGDSITGRLACSTSSTSQAWDFKDDPIQCLGGDNTQTICVSAPAAGEYQGFIKYWWGPKG